MSKKKAKKSDLFETVEGSQGAAYLGLDDPFPHSPSFPPLYGMYFNKGENNRYWGVRTLYAARKIMDIIFEDDKLAIVKNSLGELNTVVNEAGVSMRLHNKKELNELIDYQYKGKEAQWEPGHPLMGELERFKLMGFEAPQKREETAPGETKAPREKKEPKEKRPSKEGLVTIQMIAAELKIEPREARGILRKAKVNKPQLGWCWPEADVKAIKKVIKDGQEK